MQIPSILSDGMSKSIHEATLSVRVQPRASRNVVMGWNGDTLKVKLTAPPVEGAANDACLDLLADVLNMPVSRLTLLRGNRSRVKVVRISGLSKDELHE